MRLAGFRYLKSPSLAGVIDGTLALTQERVANRQIEISEIRTRTVERALHRILQPARRNPRPLL